MSYVSPSTREQARAKLAIELLLLDRETIDAISAGPAFPGSIVSDAQSASTTIGTLWDQGMAALDAASARPDLASSAATLANQLDQLATHAEGSTTSDPTTTQIAIALRRASDNAIELAADMRTLPGTTPLGPAPSAGGTVPLALAAKALTAAWGSKHPTQAPTRAALVLPLAQAIGEGSFTGYFARTNNWGAMHATRGFASRHAKDKGYGMVAFLDGSSAGKYIARMLVVPSQAIGARLFLDRVESDVGGDLTTISDASAYALALYATGYYTGNHGPSTPVKDRAAAISAGSLTDADHANVADYAALISSTTSQAQTALDAAITEPGDPAARTVGPPFAPLTDRLTPGPMWAPHTLDHARQLLGAATDNPPPGAVSLTDALAAGGEGVWMFGSGAPGGKTLPVAARPAGTSPALAALGGGIFGVVLALAGTAAAHAKGWV